jgi:lysophospholipase-2
MSSFQSGSKKKPHNRKDYTTGLNGGIIFQPQVGQHSGTIIFMHGLGDSADGLADIVEMWSEEFRHLKIILPTAPTKKITIMMGQSGNAWYDITAMDESARETDPSTGIEASQEYLSSLIEEELSQGILLSRILLMGFSQGGAMTLFTGLQLPVKDEEMIAKATLGGKYPLRFAGLLVMSGYLPKQSAFKLSDSMKEVKTVPILHTHGKDDPLVLYRYAEKTKEYLTSVVSSLFS